jgi:hypothetical protein
MRCEKGDMQNKTRILPDVVPVLIEKKDAEAT